MGEKTEHSKLTEIFSQALELDQNLRQKFLDEACQDNPHLRERVESLLNSFEKSEDFFEKPVIQVSQIQSEDHPHPPSQIPNPKLLRGDLDNIILMALRKEPSRRYASAADFSADISNYLNGLPVSARPNTVHYRASKFIQRHRISAMAGALILLAILSGAIISFVQYRKAEQEKLKAQEVKKFIQRMLLTANPSNSSEEKGGYSAATSEMLEQAVRQLDRDEFANQPEVKAELKQLIGKIYLNQGQFDLSEKYLNEALTDQTQIYGNDKKRLALTSMLLGDLYTSKANYEQAEKLYEENIPLVREEIERGNVQAGQYLLGTLRNYALLKRAKGDSKQAETLFRESLSLSSPNSEYAENINFVQMLLNLTLLDQGKFDEAENNIRQQITKNRQTTGNPTYELANSLTLLGSILMEKENLTEAKSNLQESETIYRKMMSPNSIQIFDNLRLQAQVSYLAGDYAMAEKQINQVLENYKLNANPKYISFPTALTVQGLILNKLGKTDEAEKILREAVRLRTENLPSNHFMTALTKGALGEILTTSKKFTEAGQFLRESYESLKNSQAGENQRIILAKSRLEKWSNLNKNSPENYNEGSK